jgi:hypothetical protein
MKNANALILLKENILLMELQQENDRILLKEEFKQTFEALRPVNLLKNTFHDLVQSPDFKEDLVDSALGLATGFISKKLVVGNTHNPLKQILGVLLQLAITSIVTKNADVIKSSLMTLINKFTNKNETTEDM